jgi:hypothetical protein
MFIRLAAGAALVLSVAIPWERPSLSAQEMKVPGYEIEGFCIQAVKREGSRASWEEKICGVDTSVRPFRTDCSQDMSKQAIVEQLNKRTGEWFTRNPDPSFTSEARLACGKA